MSSSRTLHVVDKITGEGVLMGSPSNTATGLSGVSPNYFRTAPPDSVQGSALANQILTDGKGSIAYLTFNDDYGTGLRDTIQEVTEAGGATTVYGGKGDGNEFPVDQTSFSSEVTAVKSANPDAIVIVTFDQINALLPELLIQGVDPSMVYLVDGNANSFADVVDLGTVTGMQGSIPGAQAPDDFRAQLEEIYSSEFGGTLESFTYGPEAYDLVTIVALAAEKAGAVDSASIQAELAAVTGANGGEECTSFADCKALLDDGEDIRYVGKSGTGPLNENNDPSSAWIGIYKYDDTNVPQFVSAVEGEVG
jgi:branched-chain amino acid transport system substrate-binding protein